MQSWCHMLPPSGGGHLPQGEPPRDAAAAQHRPTAQQPTVQCSAPGATSSYTRLATCCLDIKSAKVAGLTKHQQP